MFAECLSQNAGKRPFANDVSQLEGRLALEDVEIDFWRLQRRLAARAVLSVDALAMSCSTNLVGENRYCGLRNFALIYLKAVRISAIRKAGG